MSKHRLEVESVKWVKPNAVPFDEIRCAVCNILEDEYRLFRKFITFIRLRKKFISKYVWIRVGRKPSETDSVEFKISSKTPRGKKDSTKRHHHRHHKRQPGEQQFPIQVVTASLTFNNYFYLFLYLYIT